jgi:metal-dependent amidase/aminoacylase/carboxypeptidase family protein
MAAVTVAFTPAEVRSKQPGADAVVGNGLLRRFDCIFDYHAKRLYLRPNSRYPAG